MSIGFVFTFSPAWRAIRDSEFNASITAPTTERNTPRSNPMAEDSPIFSRNGSLI